MFSRSAPESSDIPVQNINIGDSVKFILLSVSEMKRMVKHVGVTNVTQLRTATLTDVIRHRELFK